MFIHEYRGEDFVLNDPSHRVVLHKDRPIVQPPFPTWHMSIPTSLQLPESAHVS